MLNYIAENKGKNSLRLCHSCKILTEIEVKISLSTSLLRNSCLVLPKIFKAIVVLLLFVCSGYTVRKF